MNGRTIICAWATVVALMTGAVSASDDLSQFRQVTAEGWGEASALDLSEVWEVFELQGVPVAYSSVGWDVDPVDSGNAVALTLVPVDASASPVTLVSGLTGAGAYGWTPSGVEKTTYRLSHVVSHGGVSDMKQTLTAVFDFTNCDLGGATADEIRAAAFATDSQSFDFSSDEESPWQPIGGAGEGIASAEGVASTFTLRVKGSGTLSFGHLLTASDLSAFRVLVDGVETLDLGAAAQWTDDLLTVDARGAHVVTFVFDGTDGQAGVKGLRWHEREGAFASQLSEPVAVDLREGVRALVSRTELLPFVYSATNFTGLAETVEGPTVAKVSVVKLTGEGEEVALWTDEVPGTRRVIRRATDESAVSWSVRSGVWKAEFEILDGDKSVHFESVIFDMRTLKKGFVLLVM